MRSEVAEYLEIELVLQEAGHTFQVQFRKKNAIGRNRARERSQAGPGRQTSIGQAPDKFRTSSELTPDMLRLLDFCKTERSVKEMMAFLGLRHRETFLKNYLYALMEDDLVMMTIPDKPKTPKQKYLATPKGLEEFRKGSMEMS